jgi:methylated-DNA-[protein]-cysteine S-methyltransferase
LLEATDEGLRRCKLIAEGDSLLQREVPSHPVLEQAVQELCEYFAGKRAKFEVSLAPEGTDFQLQVWNATRQIPYGQTRSYWWVAVRMGNPYAMRAVGNALGENPLMLFIPCHRVVRQDGSLGGFTPGPGWKRILLEHEIAHREKLCGR